MHEFYQRLHEANVTAEPAGEDLICARDGVAVVVAFADLQEVEDAAAFVLSLF